MKRLLFLLVVGFSFSLMAEAPKYTCNFKVEQGQQSVKNKVEGRQNNNNNRWNSNSTTKKTVTRSQTWDVKVSLRGKELPSGIEIKSYFIGEKDGKKSVIGSETIPVKLDEKGDFKVAVKAPTTEQTRTSKQTGSGRNRRSKTEISGERITGTIMQLVIGGKVVKSFTTNPTWSKLAKADSLDLEAILK